MSARWTTSKSNSSSRNHHMDNFPEASADVSNHLKASWSVRIVRRLSPKYSRSKNIAHTTEWHSLWVGACFCSALITVRDQYHIGRVPSPCCCRSTHPTLESHALLLTVNWPVVRRSTSIGGFASSVLRLSTAASSALVTERNIVECYFCSFLLKSAATLENFGTSWRTTLQKSKKDLSSV